MVSRARYDEGKEPEAGVDNGRSESWGTIIV